MKEMTTTPCANGEAVNLKKAVHGSQRSDPSADCATRNRNRRLLANLQATLGGGSGSSSERMSPRVRKKGGRKGRQPPAEVASVSSLEDALQRISISNQDICASLVDVKPFLQRHALHFTAEQFVSVAEALCDAALEQSNVYFVMEICISLVEFEHFQLSMSTSLKNLISKFLIDEGETYASVPAIIAHLFAAKWPRKYSRVIEDSNLILYAAFNTIIGWVKFLLEKSKEDKLDDGTVFLFNRCAQGIVSFCNAGQRFIWLNFPELYDEIFAVVVELLVGNVALPRDIKSGLLQLHLSMNKWSLANLPKFSNAITQTANIMDTK